MTSTKMTAEEMSKLKRFSYFYNESGDFTIVYGESGETDFVITSTNQESRAKMACQKLNEIIQVATQQVE